VSESLSGCPFAKVFSVSLRFSSGTRSEYEESPRRLLESILEIWKVDTIIITDGKFNWKYRNSTQLSQPKKRLAGGMENQHNNYHS
jgi:hypothetical protein